ncbi:MAG: asparagine synthase (glutamine-hydrolyzing) [Moheibacter sp.]
MCGIYLTNMPYKLEEVKEKLEKIKHRGPDYTGIIQHDTLILGHLRLAILDLDARSNQPYQYKNLAIVFNGEIYNFKELRDELEIQGYNFDTASDTEVLIKGYDFWGEKVLEKLNGMFSFAISNSKNNEIFCARDRLGVKPFYYYWKDGQFEICSQLQPLRNKNSKISTEAVSIYLSTGYVPSPFSIYEDIYKLQPGCILNIDLNKKTKSIKRYWDLEKVETLDISYAEAKERVKELLKDAVRIRMQSDVPLGTFLSGGIDSALVTALAAEISNEKIKTFTIGFDDPKHDESKVAEKFAKIIGTEHITTMCKVEDVLDLIPKLIKVYDEPFADSSALPSLLLNKGAKQHATVVLSGDGGDESFIGYKYFHSIGTFEKIQKIPFALRKFIAKFLQNSNKFKSILLCENNTFFIERIFVNEAIHSRNWFEENYFEYLQLSNNSIQKAADLNIKLWLENDSNVKVDRASMAYSVEVRSPFLDYRIIQLTRTLPMEYKFTDGRTKRILRDILSDYIPEDIFNQPKSGFSIPLKKWIKNELKSEIEENIQIEYFKSIKDFPQFYSNLNVENITLKWRLYILSKWLNLNCTNYD